MSVNNTSTLSSNKPYNKIYYSSHYKIVIIIFSTFWLFSVCALSLSLVLTFHADPHSTLINTTTRTTCSSGFFDIGQLSDYTDVIINVIIAIGIAFVTIDATIFIFSKSALDRFNDENRYIAKIVRIHKEKTITLLFINCVISGFAILLPLIWHFCLSFLHKYESVCFYHALGFLIANTVVYIILSFDFLKKCIRIEKYLRKVIRTSFDICAEEIESVLSSDFRIKRMETIGDWYTWKDRGYYNEAYKLCASMTPEQFINSFQKAEKLLLPDDSLNDYSIRKTKIVTTFQERKSILKSMLPIETKDLSDRYYYNKNGDVDIISDCITDFERQVDFSRDDSCQNQFFWETEKMYSILKDYCNLLISKRFTSDVSERKAKGRASEKHTERLSEFAEAFYWFYIRILSVFVSFVYISDFSFNDSSLNYANFYNSTLEKISLYGASFYRTVLSRTNFNRVIMDLSIYEDVDFYSSTLTDTSINNSKLTQVSFERAVVVNGGFDACEFKTCRIIDSEFSNCNFNNTDYDENVVFQNSDFINSKFRELNIHSASFHSCSFINSEFNNWTTYIGFSMDSCDFSKCTWTNMELNQWVLPDSVFIEANLAGIIIRDSRIVSSDFSNCILVESRITNCLMNKSNMKGASLFKSQFNNVDLTMADLSSANAVNATFENNCFLRNTNCDNADFSEAEFKNADLEAARLYNCSFTHSIINDTNCQYILADKMQFTFAECNNCDLSFGSLSDSNMTGSSFIRCDFIDADLSEVNATKTGFIRCTLENTDFSETRFVEAMFEGESPDNPMKIVNCDFSDCKFEKVSFKNVKIINCNFQDSIMIKCKNSAEQIIDKHNIKEIVTSNEKSRSITFFNDRTNIS